MTDEAFWKRCNTCKSEIGFAAPYFVCSVSTCNRPRVALVFCTIGCWDSHVPLLRHRDAWATEKTSPTRAEWEGEQAREAAADAAASALNVSTPRAPSVAPSARPEPPSPTRPPSSFSSVAPPRAAAPEEERPQPVELASGADVPHDILVVASKLKAYIRARSGMNTSDGVLDALSDRLRVLCDQAIRRAAEAGRKTVLDRDF